MKKHDKILCVNDKDSNSLIAWNFYQVTDVNQHGNVQVTPWGEDKPLQHYYKPERFKLESSLKSCATFEVGGDYECRCGDAVRLLAISNDKDFPLVGEILIDGEWFNHTWTSDGHRLGAGEEDSWDIIEKEKTREVKNDAGNYLATIKPLKEGGAIYLHKIQLTRDEFQKIADALKH